MKLPRKDQTLLEQAYTSIHEASPGSDIQHSGQGPYKAAPHGARTSSYNDKQPLMGKRDELSDPQMQAGLAILQQYAQGDITSAVEVVKRFKDLYEKGVEQGPTQDDMYYTKNK